MNLIMISPSANFREFYYAAVQYWTSNTLTRSLLEYMNSYIDSFF